MWALDRVWGPYLGRSPHRPARAVHGAVAVRFAFRVDGDTEGARLVQEGRRVNGAHPFVLSLQAMGAQERGALDEAQEYAAAVLADRPGYIPAGHVTTHVHFERGDHEGGLPGSPAGFATRYAPVVPTCRTCRGTPGCTSWPSTTATPSCAGWWTWSGRTPDENWFLSNGASYAWRLKLAGPS